jgi:hypothetical protein
VRLAPLLVRRSALGLLDVRAADGGGDDFGRVEHGQRAATMMVMVPSSQTTCALFPPARLYSRAEVLSSASPVPKAPGVYAWYFRQAPPLVPTVGCLSDTGVTLLYVGISPSQPPKNGKAPSQQSLRHRIRYHFSGNAEGSTLRLTLGCLLADQLGIKLRRVGSGKRMTFGPGEAVLSDWMSENALVGWQVCDEPWMLEKRLLSEVCLPLNLDQNRQNSFHPVLAAIRATAKREARDLPIWMPK